MKKLLGIVVLCLLLFNKSFADIRDFEIEGISIGDTLSMHYDAETQKKFKINWTNDYTGVVGFTDSNFEVYDQMQIQYKKHINKKIIEVITGILIVPDVKEITDGQDWMTKFDVCLAKQKIITDELSKLSKYPPVINQAKLENGVKIKSNELVLSDDGGVSSVYCVDLNNNDNNVKLYVSISALSKEYADSKKTRKIENVDSLILNDKSKIKFKSNDKNYALLIANSDYDFWDDLKSPSKDIDVISSILKNDYGFEVEILKNGNRDNILDKLFEYSTKTSDKDNLLIYYAGHGEIVNTNAYWISKNASKEISSKWLNVNDVDSAISMIKAKDLLVMVDACYQGTAFKSGDQKIIGPSNTEMNDEKYFYKMLNFRSAVVITSGNDERVIDEAVDGHSAFAYKFIDILNKNNKYETSTSMFIKLKKYHANLAQNPNIIRMKPWGDLGGDFIFLKK